MRFLVVIFSFFCTACVTTSGSGVVRPEYKEYSLSHALSDFESKKISDGQLIYISGYLTFGDDKHNLWGNEEGYKYRSEEHTSELQSLMRISYAVFCLKKKKSTQTNKQ